MRTSTATLEKGYWEIDLDTAVAARFKRVFDGVDKIGTKVKVSDTPRNAKDLLWFSTRHPVEFDPVFHLLSQAALEDEREEAVLRILSSEYKPSNPRLAFPLRDYQGRAVDLCLANRGILLGDDVGLGKQMPVDTKVLTPSGWRPIGEIRVGEAVIGSSGTPVKVTGVFPQGMKPSYRMWFSDGSSVESGPEHLWTVGYWRGGKKWSEIVVTTEQIRTGATIGRLSLGKTVLQIPLLSGPVVFAPSEPLPIPAYTMGQFLANGSLIDHVVLTTNTADWPDIRARLERDEMAIGAVHRYDNATRASVLNVRGIIRDLGLNVRSREKRVPPQYMRAAPIERIALLQGLMDGDGSCSATRNKVTFHSTSPGLAEDVRELVEQLGGVGRVHAYDRSHDDKPTDYIVQVRLPLSIAPFSTSRKSARVTADRRAPKRTIERVEYVRDVESVCIRVDAKDSLYVTEHSILTHNTATAIGLFARAEALPAVVVTLTSLTIQWEREVKKFAPELQTHIIKSTKPYPLDRSAKGTSLPLPDVMIMSYSKLASRSGGKSWAEVLADEGMCRAVIFDEGQELRNNDSDRYRAARYLREAATFCMLTTATPVYNHGGEIHNVVEIVQPGTLGTRIEFLREWCGRGGSTTETVEREGTGEMRKVRVEDPVALGAHLRDCGVFLRRLRAEVGRELPGLQRVIHHVNTDETLRAIDDDLIALCEKLLAGAANQRMQVAGELDWRLRRATGLSKVGDVAGFVRLLVENGQKVLVYGWHRDWYDRLSELLGPKSESDLAPAFYTGTESPQKKDLARARFIGGADLERARKYDHTLTETNVLGMSLRAGAGLDGLQHVCSTVVFGELDWSPGVHEQCLSADTEVLTKDGFRGPDEIDVGTIVCGFDMETGAMTWTPALSKVDRSIAPGEQMFGFRSKKTDIRVTGGHRMVVRRKRRTTNGVGRSEWCFETAASVAGQARRFLPLCGKQEGRGVPLRDCDLRLLGWYVTDGSFNGETLTIYQAAHQPWNADIVETLNACGIKYRLHQRRVASGTLMNMYAIQGDEELLIRPRWTDAQDEVLRTMAANGASWVVIGEALGKSSGSCRKRAKRLRKPQKPWIGNKTGRGWTYLVEYLDKDISPKLDEMTREQLLHFIHGVKMGDGIKSKRLKNVVAITGTNTKMFDRLQSLCVRRGLSARQSVYRDRIRQITDLVQRQNFPARRLWIEDLSEASIPRCDKKNGFREVPTIPGERVWCLTTAPGTLVIRRNGRVAVVGNCEGRIYRDGQNLPVVAYYLISDEGSDPVVLDALNLKTEQSEGIRNLSADVAKLKGADPEQMKNLARAFLKKRGRRVPG